MRAFLLERWSGRVLLAALIVRVVVFALEAVVPSSDLLVLLRRITTIVLLTYGAVYGARLLMGLQRRLLWRVRRKLVVSYLLMGLVPVLLVVAFFLFVGWMLMMNVSAYLLGQSLDRRVTDAEAIGNGIVSEVEQVRGLVSARQVLTRREQTLRRRYPSLSMELLWLPIKRGQDAHVVVGPWDHLSPPEELPAWLLTARRYADKLVYRDEEVADGPWHLVARAVSFSAKGTPAFCVIVDVPIDQEEADRIRGELGLRLGDVSVGSAEGPQPNVTASALSWVNLFTSRDWTSGEAVTAGLGFEAKPLELYRRLAGVQAVGSSSLTFGQVLFLFLFLVGALFLIIQSVAFVMGFSLARSITGSIHQLFTGTQRIQQGDFTHRIDVPSRDQLGELAESFNSMTRSIDHLLRQQAEKRRLEEELRIARDIQMSLLPRGPLRMPGLALAALCVPAREVGGDYYDFFPLGERRVGLLIADVAGKGTSAALYMAELKGLVLSLSQVYESPKRLLIEVNRIISENLDSRSFITMTYAIVDLACGTLTYARAGHTPLIYLPAGERQPTAQVLTPSGLVLGLRIEGVAAKFEELLEEATLKLGPGDVCVFFTDGITEAMNDEADLFGEGRLCRLVEEHGHLPSEQLRERILREVEDWVGLADQHDDMTMILVKVDPAAARPAIAVTVGETIDVPATTGP